MISKGESNGDIGMDVAVQRGAVQCSVAHNIAVQCSVVQCTVQYSTVQSSYCSSVQFSAFSVSAVMIILVSMLLSAHVERFSVSCMQDFF